MLIVLCLCHFPCLPSLFIIAFEILSRSIRLINRCKLYAKEMFETNAKNAKTKQSNCNRYNPITIAIFTSNYKI